MSKPTPMMEQYLKHKQEYPDCILFFRLGDFYEMFFEDAKIASRELGIALTARQKGGGGKAPMAGVPFHAAETYIAQLIEKGYRVAICEQLEDPKETRGIVKRGVVRVISPGTVIEEGMLQSDENNYIAAIALTSNKYGLAFADISTGELSVTEVTDQSWGKILSEISRLKPKEIQLPVELENHDEINELINNIGKPLVTFVKEKENYPEARDFLCTHLAVLSLEGFGLEGKEAAVKAAARLGRQLLTSQKRPLEYLINIHFYNTSSFMLLDDQTRRNLELNKGTHHESKRGSLSNILDHTQTAMGSRLLKKWINQPLLDIGLINKRLDCMEEFIHTDPTREKLQELLKGIYDLERLIGRISYGTASPRDLAALRSSLELLPAIKDSLSALKYRSFLEREAAFDSLADIFNRLEKALVAEPPVSPTEGGIIRDGFAGELDELRSISRGGKEWIAQLEAAERENTGIKSLKVGYNRVFGYYIEVTKTNLHLIPDNYVRKQTLANAERFFTPQLKEKENQVLGAEEKICAIEYRLFIELRDNIKNATTRIQKTASILAEIDVLISLALVALNNDYCRPLVDDNMEISIKQGRHPVVEMSLAEETFVPNDIYMNNQDSRFHIITGPNMSGKSTYLRQVALIILMAQMGSFVPAKKAQIGLVDRIFTRIGASDDLVRGKSTFLVEMNEVAQILNGASQRSFILLDEVGRGTSTFDGMSIAWAVAEFINNPGRIGARTLFATHYHELVDLEDKCLGVKNFNVAVEKKGEEVIFLHIIKDGATDESYGIHVARLAGIPPEVLYRAKEILKQLEKKNGRIQPPPQRIPLFPSYNHETDKYLQAIAGIDLMNMTPLEVANHVYEIQKELKPYLGKGGKKWAK